MTTVTLSKEQRDFAAERIRKLPREQADRITLLLTDYRSLPKLYPGKRFDKIVSIEMIEAVSEALMSCLGTSHWSTWAYHLFHLFKGWPRVLADVF